MTHGMGKVEELWERGRWRRQQVRFRLVTGD